MSITTKKFSLTSSATDRPMAQEIQVNNVLLGSASGYQNAQHQSPPVVVIPKFDYRKYRDDALQQLIAQQQKAIKDQKFVLSSKKTYKDSNAANQVYMPWSMLDFQQQNPDICAAEPKSVNPDILAKMFKHIIDQRRNRCSSIDIMENQDKFQLKFLVQGSELTLVPGDFENEQRYLQSCPEKGEFFQQLYLYKMKIFEPLNKFSSKNIDVIVNEIVVQIINFGQDALLKKIPKILLWILLDNIVEKSALEKTFQDAYAQLVEKLFRRPEISEFVLSYEFDQKKFFEKVKKSDPNFKTFQVQFMMQFAKKTLGQIILPQILTLKPTNDALFASTEVMDNEAKAYKEELRQLYIIGATRFSAVLYSYQLLIPEDFERVCEGVIKFNYNRAATGLKENNLGLLNDTSAALPYNVAHFQTPPAEDFLLKAIVVLVQEVMPFLFWKVDLEMASLYNQNRIAKQAPAEQKICDSIFTDSSFHQQYFKEFLVTKKQLDGNVLDTLTIGQLTSLGIEKIINLRNKIVSLCQQFVVPYYDFVPALQKFQIVQAQTVFKDQCKDSKMYKQYSEVKAKFNQGVVIQSSQKQQISKVTDQQLEAFRVIIVDGDFISALGEVFNVQPDQESKKFSKSQMNWTCLLSSIFKYVCSCSLSTKLTDRFLVQMVRFFKATDDYNYFVKLAFGDLTELFPLFKSFVSGSPRQFGYVLSHLITRGLLSLVNFLKFLDTVVLSETEAAFLNTLIQKLLFSDNEEDEEENIDRLLNIVKEDELFDFSTKLMKIQGKDATDLSAVIQFLGKLEVTDALKYVIGRFLDDATIGILLKSQPQLIGQHSMIYEAIFKTLFLKRDKIQLKLLAAVRAPSIQEASSAVISGYVNAMCEKETLRQLLDLILELGVGKEQMKQFVINQRFGPLVQLAADDTFVSW